MELGRVPDDSFAGYLQEDSDLEFSECSDGVSSDEGDGERRVERKATQEELSDDEFEREMESELMCTLEAMTSPAALVAAAQTGRKGAAGNTSQSRRVKRPDVRMEASAQRQLGLPEEPSTSRGDAVKESEKQGGMYYDDVYFESTSSEEEEEGGGGGEGGEGMGKGGEHQKKKVRKLTNDELFYDPHMDEEDEKWVKRQRMAYHNVKLSQQLEKDKQKRTAGSDGTRTPPVHKDGGEGSVGGRKEEGGRKKQDKSGSETQGTPLPKSDALLSCPACMTTLCIDCQQHDVYPNQYRAMFVMNCRIHRDEVLKYAPKLNKRERRRKGRRKRGGGGGSGDGEPEAGGEDEEEDYHPVHCSECNTQVAVYDKDEVFHFFNVLASAS